MVILPSHRAVKSHEIAKKLKKQNLCNLLPKMGDNPPLTPLKRSGVKPTSQKGGKRPEIAPAPVGQRKRRKIGVTLNMAVLGSIIAKALKGSFEDLRDSMNAGFAGLGNLIAAHSGDNGDKDSGDDCDSSESKNDDESLVADEPPANNRNQMNRERTAIPLLLSSRKL